MKVALVHDYLNQRGGGERVFAHIARAYPEAPVFTSLLDSHLTADLVDPRRVQTSFLQRIPFANRFFRYLAPLYPRAFESFDLSGFDVIVSSTTSWAKGVIVPPGAVHVCYVNTVSRFAFAYDEYVGSFGLRSLTRLVVRRLAAWDRKAALRPTRLVANSRNVASRIAQYYGRESTVLHCPVDLDRFTLSNEPRDGPFVIASRLLAYKRLDLAIAAAELAEVPLVIAGSGPDEGRLRKIAAHARFTQLLGYVSDAELNALLGRARGAVVPGEEDFGLFALEAAAAGCPAIAFRAGGALETVVEGRTGEFFDHASPESLAGVLREFDPRRYDRERLRAHAQEFSPARFIDRLRAIVSETRDSVQQPSGN